MSIKELVEYELKRLVGDDWKTDITEDDVHFAIKKVTQRFLDYTNQTTVPKTANYIVSDMVIALLKLNFSSVFDEEQTDQELMNKLGSISVGDTSLAFGTSKLTPSEIIDKENAMFYTFKAQMNPYRKMAVPGRSKY